MTDVAERAEKLAELSSIRELGVARGAAVERLLELLDDPEPEVRAEAAAAGASYPEAEALVEALLRRAREDAAPAVRAQALGALSGLVRAADLAGAAEPGYAPELELGEPPAELARHVGETLRGALAGEAGPAERGAAERLAALESLAYQGATPEVVAGIEALRAQGDPASRGAALRCMGRTGDARWRQVILEELDAPEEAVVLAAIGAAGEVELVSAAPLLARLLQSARQPQRHRVRAAQALGCLGGGAGARALLEVAEGDGDEAVREAARGALAGLTLLGRGGADG